jgi:hypothetical protein
MDTMTEKTNLQEFTEALEELCKKHGCRITATPRATVTVDNKTVLITHDIAIVEDKK